jgi:hypothetical protein
MTRPIVWEVFGIGRDGRADGPAVYVRAPDLPRAVRAATYWRRVVGFKRARRGLLAAPYVPGDRSAGGAQ